MGLRVGLDVVEKRNIMPVPGIEPRPSSPQPISVPTELSRLKAFSLLISKSYHAQHRISFFLLLTTKSTS
jgi:hypothetical protein